VSTLTPTTTKHPENTCNWTHTYNSTTLSALSPLTSYSTIFYLLYPPDPNIPQYPYKISPSFSRSLRNAGQSSSPTSDHKCTVIWSYKEPLSNTGHYISGKAVQIVLVLKSVPN